ncbi:fructosamine kinase family protein [Actinomycetospora lutea]|uniref:fructosamine kinase family protein n=1 Tax=Actinomycetospora lutea TaxID=663604 RepID=UPI0023663A54|nr:fructosamine kinase family protein [Actinomycetospora lutea]MDD7942203.1 fructosamine kinase family protein [Actinomycetospora lutea]
MTTLDDGTEVVVKSGEPSAIAAEAAGLRWLAEPGAVGVPEVLGETEGRMVSTRVPPGRADRDAAERFGRGLAALHAAGAPAFGAPPPGGPVHAWIGEARMVNETGGHWPSWYAEHRVLPHARRALGGDDLALVERACARFDAVAGPPEPPARLHGDLWTGNVLWAGGQGWVIDPAAHGGHRETDVAMLALFGAPQLETILAAYDEAAPLADGWRDRVGLHQLWPLLVHAELFGGGYGDRALAVCERIT